MDYVKGKSYTFPVSEVMLKPLWGKYYFNVLANGNMVRVPAMEFQRNNKPTELQVICTSDDPKNLKFEQDRAVLLPQLYEPGKEYEFKVVSDSPSNGGYRLQDSNGWSFKLEQRKREKLMRYSVIKCRVVGIRGTDLDLELVTENKVTKAPVLSIADVGVMDDNPHPITPLLEHRLRRDRTFAEAMAEYDQGNPLWVLLAVDATRVAMTRWVTLKPKNALRLLNGVRSIAMTLLQTSNFLDTYSPSQREEYRKRLMNFILSIEDYIEAFELVDRGLDQKYVDDTLQLIRQAFYIYRPERRMHVLMAIFTIKVAYVSGCIHQIFAIIKERHDTKIFMDRLNKAFSEMLELYISNSSKFVNAESKSSVKDMMEALALWLLLLSDRSDRKELPRLIRETRETRDEDHSESQDAPVDPDIYRARLYRYASMLVGRDAAATLLMHAYCLLLSPEDGEQSINWKDLDNIQLTALAMTRRSMPRSFASVFTFEARNAELSIDGTTMRLRPTVKSATKWVTALPADLLPDFDISVDLNERLSEKPGGVGRSIPKAHRLWTDLEASLFTTVAPVKTVKRRKPLPPVGQTVTVRITDMQWVMNGEKKEQIYGCQVVSPDYTGAGFIRRENLVTYPAKIDASLFRNEEGVQRLLDAQVLNIQGDSVEFSLRHTLQSTGARMAEEYRQRNAEDRNWISDDADIVAIVTGGDEIFNARYLCVSEFGFALSIDKKDMTDTLAKGDLVSCRIHYVDYKEDEEKLYVKADVRDFVDEVPLAPDAIAVEVSRYFSHLVEEASRDRLYIPDDEDPTADANERPVEYLSHDTLHELIATLSSRAAAYTDYFTAFNLLAFTRIIALMAGEAEEADIINLRMELIRAIDQFSNNGRPDISVIAPLLEQCRKLRDRDQDLNIKLSVLTILSSLDRPITESIHIPAASIDDGRLNKMARLAIAYNALGGLEFGDEQFQLRSGLYTLAGLEYTNRGQTDAVTVADGEDQTTEFKSSLIYPADNKMKADEKKQVKEIMQIVCGFLNSRLGGTLYIGADNFGQPVGLERDFAYLSGGRHDYDMQLVKDKFELLFRNGFYDHFGVTQGGYNLSADNVETSFEQYGKHTVYVVRVKPAAEAVTMTDGLMFVRQGTSTRPIVGEDNQDKFRTVRAKK
ncbi:MAG: ATP-binding protein [Candidatus Amulumruptor caecigallinarius]|nr:ATP-binding protein [Candidatus Amulumruptor caecigallinarius]MCM1397266.1 ATP-binding protein [Candidatus Amulumruptor caecigallinarius]MCM1453669.1 ATP-binding protein [bacterium]